MKAIFTFFLSLSVASASIGQSYIRDAASSGPASFESLENSFRVWSEGRVLDDEKGWKWYKRWEEHYKTRLDVRGSVVDQKNFLQEAAGVMLQKHFDRGTDASDWQGVGPVDLPPSPNPVSGHGLARINCIAFHPGDENIFWIGASQGGVWKTTDGGNSWTAQNSGLPILRISDIAVDPASPDVLYACLGDYEYNGVALNLDDRKRHTHYGLGLYKSSDGGNSWSATGLTVLQETLDYSLLRRCLIQQDNTSNLLAGGFEGIWRSTDAGENWENVVEDLLISDLEAHPTQYSTVYAASTYVSTLNEGTAGIWKSEDFGQSWTELNTGIPEVGEIDRIELAIAPSNPDVIYAIAVNLDGGLYAIYRSSNGGATWSQQTDENTPNILHWYEGFGVGGQGSYDLALVVDPLDENKLYAGGVNMWGSEDGGVTWNGMSYWVNYYGQSIHADQHQFKFNPLNNKFYVTNDGGVMTSDQLEIGSWEDALNLPGYEWPTQWTDLSEGMQLTSFYRLDVANGFEGALIAGSQDNSTFVFNGSEWWNIIGGDGMDCLMHPEDPNMLIGSYQYGNLVGSFNGGMDLLYGLSEQVLNLEEGEWTTPFFLHDGSETVYAGFGNVWRSENFGLDWERMSDFDNMPGVFYPSPASALDVCDEAPEAIYVAKRLWYSLGVQSEVWMSPDQGNSWNNITAGLPNSLYFTDLKVHHQNPEIAWITVSGFEEGLKVFRTEDSGQTWANISFNLPNIPVNCIIQDEASDGEVLYLGTDLGVYSLVTGQDEWQPFMNNLPNVIISDLDINTATAELYAASFGRGIWKTGIPLIADTEELTEVRASLKVFPNPSHGSFSVQLPAVQTHNRQLNIIDLRGRVVKSVTVPLATQIIQLDLRSELAPGKYLLSLDEGRLKTSIVVD